MDKKILGLLAVAAMLASLGAQAQLKSVDDGAAAIDRNGLMWANTVGINLGWSPNPAYYAYTAQGWIASLNASDYGGYNDWTLATGDGGVPNTTTNQLGELFYTDCRNTIGTLTSLKKGCGALSALSNAIKVGTNGASGDVNISSSTSLGLVPGENYYAWMIYRTYNSTESYWDADTNNNGVVGVGDALAVREAPELDPTSAGSGLTLLLGSIAVLRGRRTARSDNAIG